MNVLIIGYGSIGKRHTEVLSSLQEVKKINIVTRQNITEFSSFPALESVSDLSQYDYFVIASETYRHKEQLQYLEQAVSNKLILIEKPLFASAELIEVANNSVYVAYNLRFHPIIQRIREWLEGENAIAAHMTVGQYLPEWRTNTDYRKCYSADKEKGGGVLLDLSHEIDYIQWLFGKMDDFSFINTTISGLEITSDDYLSLIGKSNRGTYINLSMDYINRIPMRQVLIHTQNSTIRADLVVGTLSRKIDQQPLEEVSFKGLDRNVTYTRMHQALLSGRCDGACTFSEGSSVMNTIGIIQERREETC